MTYTLQDLLALVSCRNNCYDVWAMRKLKAVWLEQQWNSRFAAPEVLRGCWYSLFWSLLIRKQITGLRDFFSVLHSLLTYDPHKYKIASQRNNIWFNPGMKCTIYQYIVQGLSWALSAHKFQVWRNPSYLWSLTLYIGNRLHLLSSAPGWAEHPPQQHGGDTEPTC